MCVPRVLSQLAVTTTWRDATSANAQQVDGRYHGQHGRRAEPANERRGDEAGENADQCPDRRDLAKAFLGRSRIESFTRDQPEARAQQRPHFRDVQKKPNGHDTGRARDEKPFADEEHRAGSKQRRHASTVRRGPRLVR